MLTIGEFSAATKLTIKALRIYHEEGLLVPERIDADNGYRQYGDADFRRAQAIVILRDLGFSIKEMKEVFSRCGDDAELGDFFRRKLAETERELLRMREVRGRIQYYAELGEGEPMKKNLEITERDIDDQWICSLRYTGGYGDIGKYFGELFKKAGRWCAGKPFALYYDREYREQADIEASVTVRREVAIPGIVCRKLLGGHFASIVYRGPYDRIGEAYKALFDYLEDKGLEADTPSREIYHKGPGMFLPRAPKDYVTEIQVPLKGKN